MPRATRKRKALVDLMKGLERRGFSPLRRAVAPSQRSLRAVLELPAVAPLQPLPHAVRAHIAGLQDALQVAAADVLDHALLHGALAQLVQRRRGPALSLGRLARQGQQLQPLGVADAPGPSGPRHLL